MRDFLRREFLKAMSDPDLYFAMKLLALLIYLLELRASQ